MLRRKMYDQLLSWKVRKQEKGIKECLLIKGARQVGKSFIVEQFGKENYESFISINFIKQSGLKEAFEGDKDPERIYYNLSILLPNLKLIPGKTLFFLDEIQNCGAARTALKFLSCDTRYDFIASGSLLGLEYGEDGDEGVEVPESIPVGYESEIVMYPLDFEEYLWAKGYGEKQIGQLKEYFDKKTLIPDVINKKMEELFREYIVVGGMPEVVATFVKENKFNEAFRIQDKILNDYRNDISKHAKGEEKLKVNACYESVPKQLSKEMKRFQYSLVEKKKTSRKYGGSVKWLKDSGLVNPCYNVSEPEIPLLGYEKEDQFKLYLNDTGLLTELYGREAKVAVFNNTIKGTVKGAIYENIVSQILVSKGYKLHYYRPDDEHELEFVIEKEGEVLPIEVKAGKSASPSLNKFIAEYNPHVAYKIINGNIGLVDTKFTMPHYLALFL